MTRIPTEDLKSARDMVAKMADAAREEVAKLDAEVARLNNDIAARIAGPEFAAFSPIAYSSSHANIVTARQGDFELIGRRDAVGSIAFDNVWCYARHGYHLNPVWKEKAQQGIREMFTAIDLAA